MKLNDILIEQQLDEINLRQAVAGGLVGLAGLGMPKTVDTQPTQVVHQQPKHILIRHSNEGERKYLTDRVLAKYNVDDQLARDIVDLAFQYEKPEFPRARDILALVGIESSFDPEAESTLRRDPARGLMQVRAGIWKIDPMELKDIRAQIMHGANILQYYYTKLGTKARAIKAYNVGLTAWRHRKDNQDVLDATSRYYKKYNREIKHYNDQASM